MKDYVGDVASFHYREKQRKIYKLIVILSAYSFPNSLLGKNNHLLLYLSGPTSHDYSMIFNQRTSGVLSLWRSYSGFHLQAHLLGYS